MINNLNYSNSYDGDSDDDEYIDGEEEKDERENHDGGNKDELVIMCRSNH